MLRRCKRQTQEISTVEGNLTSSFHFVFNGNYRFNIISFIGATGNEELSSVRVDKYAQYLATRLALSSQEAARVLVSQEFKVSLEKVQPRRYHSSNLRAQKGLSGAHENFGYRNDCGFGGNFRLRKSTQKESES